MQLMLEKPDLARELGVQPPTGILLKGPPGTGKTTIARILANEAKCSFFAITPAEVNQMYVGESEKRVKELFNKARSAPPSIIFIDEIDALLPIRQGGVAIHSDKVVNQFLQEMDGLTGNTRVFIVGATNRPDMIDPALRRGGRLSREIEIPIPNTEARKQLFELCTREATLATDVNLDELVAKTDGYAGADIKALVNEAGLQALIRIADSTEKNIAKTLTMADFLAALENLG
jgi:transitional endoplasmic reticulum ATPase